MACSWGWAESEGRLIPYTTRADSWISSWASLSFGLVAIADLALTQFTVSDGKLYAFGEYSMYGMVHCSHTLATRPRLVFGRDLALCASRS